MSANDYSVALGNKLLGAVLTLALTVRKQIAREGAFLALALTVAVGIAVGVAQISPTPAYAASEELDETDGAAVKTAFSGANVITNTTDNTDDFLAVDTLSGTEVVASIDSNFDGTLIIVDGDAGTDSLTVTTFVDVASGTTLTVFVGNTKTDSSGTDTLASTGLTVTGNLGEANGVSRGGTLVLQGAGDITGDFGATLTVGGNVLMTQITASGGVGGTASGADATITLGDASDDTIDVLGLTLTGAAGATGGVVASGNATVTVKGVATVGASGITLTGGDGGTFAGAVVGGFTQLTFDQTSTITGDISVTGGNGNTNAGANGSTATLTFTGAATATAQTLTITGGAGNATNGDGGNALVNAADDLTFTSIVLDDGIANGATGGTATITFNGGVAQTITSTITAAADGEGTIIFSGDSGATSDIVTITGAVGSSTASIGTITSGVTTAQTSSKFDSDVFANTITHGLNANWAGDTEITMDFDGNVTFTTLTITGGSTAAGEDATVTAAKNLTGTTITLNDNTGQASLVLDGSTAQTVTAAINSGTDGQGDITVSNTGGTVTFSSALGDSTGNSLNDITLDASTTTVFSGKVDADTITASGTVTFEVAGSTLDEDFALANGSKIIISSTITNGQSVVTLGAQATDLVGRTINIVMPLELTDGQSVVVIDGSQALAANGTFSTNGNALFDYIVTIDGSGTAGGTNDVEVTVTKRSASAIASTLGTTTAAAEALNNGVIAAAGDATLTAAYSTALTAGGAAAKQAAEQSQNSPTALMASSAVAASVGTQVFGVGTDRLASLREGAAYTSAAGTGFATGNEGLGNSVWIRPFTYIADQGARGGIAGYEADTFGLAGGWDAKFGEADNWTAGLALSYANSDVDGEGAGNSDINIDSYQTTLYGDYTTSRWYVEGLVGYARNEVDTTRQFTFGGLDLTARGDYSSEQYMMRVGAGVPLEVGSNSFLTPHVGFQYTHVDSDSYTETGAGALNLTVNPEDIDIALGIVGARYNFNVPTENGIVTPEIRGSLLYDFVGDEAQSTSTFTGGGAAFQVAGADVAQLGWSFGAGLNYTTDDGRMIFGAGYDAEFKNDFVGHAGRIKFRLLF